MRVLLRIRRESCGRLIDGQERVACTFPVFGLGRCVVILHVEQQPFGRRSPSAQSTVLRVCVPVSHTSRSPILIYRTLAGIPPPIDNLSCIPRRDSRLAESQRVRRQNRGAMLLQNARLGVPRCLM